jgi:hypothetical protein
MTFLLLIKSFRYRIVVKKVTGPLKGTHSNYAYTELLEVSPVETACQILGWEMDLERLSR